MIRNKKGHAGLNGLVTDSMDLVGHLGAAPSRAVECTDLIGGFSNNTGVTECQQ